VVQIRNSKSQENAYSEFIKSLKKSDKEFIGDMIQEWKRQEEEDGKDTGHGKND
jgi:hypothetical protein